MKTAIVLFSGGQDSTTCLYLAKTMFDKVVALSVYYGQRHVAELDAAREIASAAKVERYEVDMDFLGQLGGSALIDDSRDLKGSGGLVDAAMPEGLPTSFVPGRNLLMLSLAAALAVREGARDIVTGVCQTDYSGYPDCRQEFVTALERAVNLAMPTSCGPLRIHAPLMQMSKAETVQLAKRLPGCWEAIGRSVTCYHGHRPGCGECPSCKLRVKGFAEAGQEDPAYLDAQSAT